MSQEYQFDTYEEFLKKWNELEKSGISKEDKTNAAESKTAADAVTHEWVGLGERKKTRAGREV